MPRSAHLNLLLTKLMPLRATYTVAPEAEQINLLCFRLLRILVILTNHSIIMKTFSKIIALAAMVLMLANCDKQNRQETLSITPEELSFGEDGQTQSFIIETEEAWNITTDGETLYSVTPLIGQGNRGVQRLE